MPRIVATLIAINLLALTVASSGYSGEHMSRADLIAIEKILSGGRPTGRPVTLVSPETNADPTAHPDFWDRTFETALDLSLKALPSLEPARRWSRYLQGIHRTLPSSHRRWIQGLLDTAVYRFEQSGDKAQLRAFIQVASELYPLIIEDDPLTADLISAMSKVVDYPADPLTQPELEFLSNAGERALNRHAWLKGLYEYRPPNEVDIGAELAGNREVGQALALFESRFSSQWLTPEGRLRPGVIALSWDQLEPLLRHLSRLGRVPALMASPTYSAVYNRLTTRSRAKKIKPEWKLWLKHSFQYQQPIKRAFGDLTQLMRHNEKHPAQALSLTPMHSLWRDGQMYVPPEPWEPFRHLYERRVGLSKSVGEDVFERLDPHVSEMIFKPWVLKASGIIVPEILDTSFMAPAGEALGNMLLRAAQNRIIDPRQAEDIVLPLIRNPSFHGIAMDQLLKISAAAYLNDKLTVEAIIARWMSLAQVPIQSPYEGDHLAASEAAASLRYIYDHPQTWSLFKDVDALSAARTFISHALTGCSAEHHCPLRISTSSAARELAHQAVVFFEGLVSIVPADLVDAKLMGLFIGLGGETTLKMITDIYLHRVLPRVSDPEGSASNWVSGSIYKEYAKYYPDTFFETTLILLKKNLIPIEKAVEAFKSEWSYELLNEVLHGPKMAARMELYQFMHSNWPATVYEITQDFEAHSLEVSLGLGAIENPRCLSRFAKKQRLHRRVALLRSGQRRTPMHLLRRPVKKPPKS